ncbi:MAG: AarF/ABC1/UbiB kinase family protein [Wenzhouxiangella sp.]|nr:MAG: AarF/ABC1/UbiB kinase family protein [Wenzhouxiangella sp.]
MKAPTRAGNRPWPAARRSSRAAWATDRRPSSRAWPRWSTRKRNDSRRVWPQKGMRPKPRRPPIQASAWTHWLLKSASCAAAWSRCRPRWTDLPNAGVTDRHRGRGRHLLLACLGSLIGTLWRIRFGLIRGQRRRTIVAGRTRQLCERLGPAFIKLGQLASIRPDVFAPETVFELERLQDRVAPVPTEDIRSLLARELGQTPDDLFDAFEQQPVAAGSVAQVHRARLKQAYRPVHGREIPAGTLVAVKVQRPGIEPLIDADLGIARRWARRLARFPRLRRWRPVELLDEFTVMLAREMDLRNEGRIADRFGRDFADDGFVIVPRVVWRHTTRRVLVSEFVEGWRLNEIGEAERAGVDARRLAAHGAEVFMRQVLVLGYFHADLHPANLFVTPNGQLCFLDFGIVGRTTPDQREAIAQVLIGLVYGDADRALRYSRELGLVVPEVKVGELRSRIEELVHAFLLDPPIADVRGFALGFLGMLADFRIAIPAGFGLLVKALVTVEGVSHAIYPDLDLIESAKPFATGLIAEQLLHPDRLRRRLPEAGRAALEAFLA